jgi:hypothetical protein
LGHPPTTHAATVELFMDYVNVFDGTKATWPWHALLIPLGIACAGLALGIYVRYRRHPEGSAIADWAGSVLAFLFAGSALVTAAFMMINSGQGCKDVTRVTEAGNFHVVEGVVHNYVPPWPDRNGIESFTIGNIQFRYSSGGAPCTFNYTLNSGFIRDGVRARIAYRDTDISLGSDILKIDVASADVPQGRVAHP